MAGQSQQPAPFVRQTEGYVAKRASVEEGEPALNKHDESRQVADQSIHSDILVRPRLSQTLKPPNFKLFETLGLRRGG
eukprot:2760731-Amphidinium_carterae.1